jgi:GNAT superfamily N-acetyltransferase
MTSLAFRDATIADAHSVADLHTTNWQRFYRGVLPDGYLDGTIVEERRALWRERLSHSQHDRQLVHLALDDTNLVGFTCVLADEEPERGALLDNLHVLESHQGLGIGRQLFRQSARWASRIHPGQPMHLWVFEANQQARGFYDALGGKIVERRAKVIAGADVMSLCYVWDDPGEASARI